MTRKTHIKLLLAHLDKLLETSEDRTPGTWKTGRSDKTGRSIVTDSSNERVAGAYHRGIRGESDSAFIASCAGNAEDGWRATRSTLLWLLEHGVTEGQIIDSILESWPIETLQ